MGVDLGNVPPGEGDGAGDGGFGKGDGDGGFGGLEKYEYGGGLP